MFARRRPQTLSVVAATLAVAALMPGSFGMSGFGTPASRSHSLTTHVQPARRTLAPVLESRATQLTNETQAYAGVLHARQGNNARLARGLVALSRARQQTMVQLFTKDPQAARRLLLPANARQALGRVRGARVEQKIALSGRYRIWHRDDFRDRKDIYLDQLVTHGGRKVLTMHLVSREAWGSTPPRNLKPNARLSVHGYQLGDDVLVTRVRTARTRSLAAGSPSVGALNVAVIAANFSDSTTSIDMNALTALYTGAPGNDVVDYFNEASYGKMQVVPTFFGPYRMAESTQSGCSPPNETELMNLANTDVDFTKFQRLVFVFNCTGFGASASSAGSMSTPDGTVTAAVIAEDADYSKKLYTQIHELSHTLGNFNRHASAFICLPDAFIPPTQFDRGCDTAEYGDPFDVLGGGAPDSIAQLDPYHKSVAGWLDPSQFPAVTTTGTYTVAPYEAPGSGIAALNIPRGTSGTSFTVEYRQPIGFDKWMSSCSGCTVTQGASIRFAGYQVAGGGGGSDTETIDTTPGTIVGSAYYYPISDIYDGALLPGKTFTDPQYGITITTVSAGQSGLVVQVTVPQQPCTPGAPTATTPSPSSQSGSGQSLTYTFTLTNTDSAGCSANSFRFFRSWSYSNMKVVATPDVLTLSPGASANISVSVAPNATTTAGTTTFSPGQFYSNTLGNYSVAVPALAYQLTASADTSPPTTPTSAVASAAGSSVARLDWSASTDNVGVIGYRIMRDNSLTFVTPSTTFVDTSLAASSTHSYSIQAFDAKGNYSQATTVTVSTPTKNDFTPPTRPLVTATATDRVISVSWSPSLDNVGIAAYRLSPCLIPNCSNLPANTTSLTIGGLTTQTRYDLTITALDGDGNAAAAQVFTVYTGPLGDSPPPQPQQLYSSSGTFGGANLTWTASAGATSYEVYRNNRPIASVTGTSFTDPLAGSHEYYVQAQDAAGGLSAPTPRMWAPAPVSASTDATPPTASVTGPAKGASVSGVVTVSAQASDNVGVSRVEFYVDGQLAGTSSSSPFTFQWDTTRLSDGSHWIYARAYDAAGNYGTAGVTTVTVGSGGSGDTTPPAVSLDSPLSGTIVSGSVPVSATATDNVGVTQVQFSVDGSPAATSTTTPYGFTWDASGASAGTHTVTATAYDEAGNSNIASATVSVAAAADTTPPTVSISSPANSATVSGTTSVQVSASDDVAVTQLTLSVDGSDTGTLTAAPWTFSLDTTKLANGSHTLAATASDAAGNKASAQVTVMVQNGAADTTPPKAPSNLRAAVTGNTQVALYWTPSTDNVGVAGYSIYRDGSQIAQTTLPNYLDSGLAPNTSHVYSVRAFDAVGSVSLASSNLNAKTASLSTSSTGTVAGVVYNSLGRPFANVVVQLTGNGLTKTAKTGNSGSYKFGTLPPGQYTLTLTMPSTSGLAASSTSSGATVVAGTTTVVTTP